MAETIDKKGRKLVKADLEAGGKSKGRAVLFTASDQEADAIGLLRLILIEQRQIKLHLASMSDENIREKDAED